MRMNILSNYEFTTGMKNYDEDIDYEGIKNDSVAFVSDRIILDILKQNLKIKYGMMENIDYHVSKSEDISSNPMFLISNPYRLKSSLTSELDKMYIYKNLNINFNK